MDQKHNVVVGDATKARFISAIIDNLIAMVLTIVVVGLMPEDRSTLRIVVLISVFLGYYFVLETFWGRTIGKYLQGLIVKKLDGTAADWKTALVRTVLRVLEVNPILFGAIPAGIVLISTERKQRLGDILAGSVVVSDKLKWSSVNE